MPAPPASTNRPSHLPKLVAEKPPDPKEAATKDDEAYINATKLRAWLIRQNP